METQQALGKGTPLSTREACRYLDVSPSTLYSLVANGELPSHKPGGKKRYYWKRDLDAWINGYSKVTPNREMKR